MPRLASGWPSWCIIMDIGQIPDRLRISNSFLVFSGLWPFLTNSAVMSSMPNQIARRPPSRQRGSRSWFLNTSNSVRLRAEEDRVTERFAVDLPLARSGENIADGFAVVEEVIVGAEKGVDAGALGQHLHFMAEPFARF